MRQEIPEKMAKRYIEKECHIKDDSYENNDQWCMFSDGLLSLLQNWHIRNRKNLNPTMIKMFEMFYVD